MKRLICCFRGEGSVNAVQDPEEQQQEPEQPQAPEQPPAPEQPQAPEELQEQQLSDDNASELDDDDPPLPANSVATFPWREIVEGTLNFRRTHLLGRGNFGDVYRCDFPRIDKVGAAKIQDPRNEAGCHEFVAEVTTLDEADHPNVIKLLGKCYEDDHRALVYEFMPNGSLDHHLIANEGTSQGVPQGTRVLDWETRMRIAVGVAKGLVYVHTRLKAVHRDIKAGNILLDQHFEPKLADFGLATSIFEGEDGFEREGVRRFIKGTPGYIAPETEMFGRFSTKSDVYSYGVLLLQLFTGKKAFDLEKPEETRNLADWFLSVWTNRDVNTAPIVDDALRNRFSVEGLEEVLVTARMCIGLNAVRRPDMHLVERMLVEAAANSIPG